MADIDEIISGARGNTKFDPSAIGDPVKSFFDASKQRAEFDTRRAFKDGVPTDENGNPDFGAIAKTFFQKGDYQQGVAAANLDLQRQQLKFGQQQSEGITGFESGNPPQRPPLVSPPSANRSASVPVAPPLNRGGVDNQSPRGDQPGSIVGAVSSAGIPDNLAGPVIGNLAKALGIDPNAPIPPALVPRVQQALQSYTARSGGGAQPGAPQPGQPLPQPGQPPQQPVPQPQVQPPQGQPAAQPGQQPAPVTNAITTQGAPQAPSRIDQAIAYYAGIMSNPMSPKNNVELAKVRLEALQKSAETTPEQKNYAQAVTQGYRGTMADFQTDQERKKAEVKDDVTRYGKKYDAVVKAGQEAQDELPQLDLAAKVLQDGAYTGPGEGLVKGYKRLVSVFGGDPNTALPQDAFHKLLQGSVLSQIRGMAGAGPVRVAEIKIIERAVANAENSLAGNRMLVEIARRLNQRRLEVSDMATKYNNGRLDAGFDSAINRHNQQNALFSKAELDDPRLVAPLIFKTPEAVAAAKLPKGTPFKTPDGRIKYVP